MVTEAVSTPPPEVRDRSAWYGCDLTGSTDWIESLSETEITEVESAVRELEASQRDIATITAADVSLPTLGPRLQQIGRASCRERV